MNTLVKEGALFEALNARALSAAAIARSFVIPPQFDNLCAPGHSYLIGPRGSGKTTLLRMLNGNELGLWDHPKAEYFRKKISYSSVFVPADRLWMQQAGVDSNDKRRARVGFAAFRTQVLGALVQTLQYRQGASGSAHVMHPVQISLGQEEEIARGCALAWGLAPETYTLVGLQNALEMQLHLYGSFLEDEEVDNAEYVSLDKSLKGAIAPIRSLTFGVRQINKVLNEPDHKWAVLLDEMELAPKALHQTLMKSVRGGPTEIFLKLSFSPFDQFATTASEYEPTGQATPVNDFTPVYLWSGNRKGSRRFAEDMFARLSLEVFDEARRPIDVLGPSVLDSSGATWSEGGYENDSPKMAFMREMRDLDVTFSDYLARRNIDLDDVSSMSYEERSGSLRRFYPLLVFRDALLSFRAGTVSRRSRKKVVELMGVDAVLGALEGNPRWMKAIFGRMLADAHKGKVPPGDQYDALNDAAERFESLLRLLPSPRGGGDGRVLAVVDAIAGYFNQRALGAFSPDVPTTFVVDEDVPESIQEVMKTALYAGAVLHLRRPKSPPVLSSLIDEKFRVAYLLSLRDHLEVPMHLGKTVRLSAILAHSEQSRLPLFEGAGVD